MTKLGIISDTHKLLRPEAIEVLEGSDLIIHAGDIGNAEIIEKLRTIAPVRAVRGNIDKSPWGDEFPYTEAFEFAGKCFYVLHIVQDLDLDPAAAGFDVVISGHSHIPKIETKNSVLYINPGSAGPRRFKLPISLATLQISGDSLEAELHTLRV